MRMKNVRNGLRTYVRPGSEKKHEFCVAVKLRHEQQVQPPRGFLPCSESQSARDQMPAKSFCSRGVRSCSPRSRERDMDSSCSPSMSTHVSEHGVAPNRPWRSPTSYSAGFDWGKSEEYMFGTSDQNPAENNNPLSKVPSHK